MSDPRRLLDEPLALEDPELKALLAGRDLQPDTRRAQQVWLGLLAKLPPGSGPGTPETPAGDAGGALGSGAGAAGTGAAGATGVGAAKSALVITVAKSACVGMALGASVAGGMVLIRPAASDSNPPVERAEQPIRRATAPVAAGASARRALPAPSPAPTAQAVAPARPPPPALATPQPTPRKPHAGAVISEPARAAASTPTDVLAQPSNSEMPASTRDERVANNARNRTPEPTPPANADANLALSERQRAESILVAEARDALRSKQADRALALLERARREFSPGALGQEREALVIEALLVSGKSQQARTRAERFLQAYPRSPHAARVQALIR